MQWTGLNELREKYLSFFESKGHLRLDSFPLVPKNDPSLLLINSGMAPMKKWFLAQEEPPRHRVSFAVTTDKATGVFRSTAKEPFTTTSAKLIYSGNIPTVPRSIFLSSTTTLFFTSE